MKTRPVSSGLFATYLKRAEEFFLEAGNALASRRWNATVVNSIHCGISAADALTVFFKGIRHAGERHEDSIGLLRTLDLDKEETDHKARQLQRLLQIKNEAEYEEKLMTRTDAENAIRYAERFFQWAKEKLAQTG